VSILIAVDSSWSNLACRSPETGDLWVSVGDRPDVAVLSTGSRFLLGMGSSGPSTPACFRTPSLARMWAECVRMVSTPSCTARAISCAPGRREAARGWAWTNGASSCSPRRWDATWKGDQTRVHSAQEQLGWRLPGGTGGGGCGGPRSGVGHRNLARIHHPMARRPQKTWPPMGRTDVRHRGEDNRP
jgi:hypothetical protein